MTDRLPRPGAAGAPPGFDPERPHRLSPRVGLRPEPFGALAYHFDTRRLVFLKSPDLVDLVRVLADHPSVVDAVAASVDARRHRSFVAAVASLAEAGVVEPIPPAPAAPARPAPAPIEEAS